VYELIVRVLDHLPAHNQQMTRYWGFYSNVARGKRRAAARRLAAGLDPDDDNLGDADIGMPAHAPSRSHIPRRCRRSCCAPLEGECRRPPRRGVSAGTPKEVLVGVATQPPWC
jgi:hypothetical protein